MWWGLSIYTLNYILVLITFLFITHLYYSENIICKNNVYVYIISVESICISFQNGKIICKFYFRMVKLLSNICDKKQNIGSEKAENHQITTKGQNEREIYKF